MANTTDVPNASNAELTQAVTQMNADLAVLRADIQAMLEQQQSVVKTITETANGTLRAALEASNANYFAPRSAPKRGTIQQRSGSGELIATWKYAAQLQNAASQRHAFAVAVFMLGNMHSVQTFDHVQESDVGDVYAFTNGHTPKPWSPANCGGCMAGISKQRRPVHLSTVRNTVYLTLMARNFKSTRYYPLIKLDLLKFLPANVNNILLADADAKLLPWYAQVFGAHLARAPPSAWVLASQSGVRTSSGALMPGLDGPQPGGALIRLDVLREFDHNCSISKPGRDTWSWWLCVLEDGRSSPKPELKKQTNAKSGDLFHLMGEMRIYKILEVIQPSAWMRLPCTTHLDTQTLFDAFALDQRGKSLVNGSKRICPVSNVHDVAVIHGAAGQSKKTTDFANRMINCHRTNRTTTPACWEGAMITKEQAVARDHAESALERAKKERAAAALRLAALKKSKTAPQSVQQRQQQATRVTLPPSLRASNKLSMSSSSRVQDVPGRPPFSLRHHDRDPFSSTPSVRHGAVPIPMPAEPASSSPPIHENRGTPRQREDLVASLVASAQQASNSTFERVRHPSQQQQSFTARISNDE